MYRLFRDDFGWWHIQQRLVAIASFEYEHHARTFLEMLEDAYKLYSGD